MFKHQITNSIDKNVFNICMYRNIRFSGHIHKSYEYVSVLEGELHATVSGVTYCVRPGEGLLICPFQIHSFDREPASRCYITVFSGHWVEKFAKTMANKQAESPLFVPDPRTEAYVRGVFVPAEPEDCDFLRCPLPDPLSTKAALYAICADFLNKSQLRERNDKKTEWLAEALMYIESNYTSDISLASLSRAIGYDYEYISRTFNRAMGVSFKTLVNQYRCERAQYLIENTEDSLTDIAFASGFQSVRTFNRVMKEKMGRFPSDLRK